MSAAKGGAERSSAHTSSLPTTISGLLREHIYDGHENCDDSCSKKQDYTDLITDLLAAFEKHLPEKKAMNMDLISRTQDQMIRDTCYTEGWNDCIDHITQLIKENKENV